MKISLNYRPCSYDKILCRFSRTCKFSTREGWLDRWKYKGDCLSRFLCLFNKWTIRNSQQKFWLRKATLIFLWHLRWNHSLMDRTLCSSPSTLITDPNKTWIKWQWTSCSNLLILTRATKFLRTHMANRDISSSPTLTTNLSLTSKETPMEWNPETARIILSKICLQDTCPTLTRILRCIPTFLTSSQETSHPTADNKY